MNRIAQQPVTLSSKKMASMKLFCRFTFYFFLMSLFNSVNAQRILISEPDREDSRKMDFEIIGKMGNNYLIYKNIRNESFICLYDNDMKMIDKVKHEYLPDDKMINVDFFAYPRLPGLCIFYYYQIRQEK